MSLEQDGDLTLHPARSCPALSEINHFSFNVSGFRIFIQILLLLRKMKSEHTRGESSAKEKLKRLQGNREYLFRLPS